MNNNEIKDTNSNQIIRYSFRVGLISIILWIAIWGISDNILNIFVSYDNYYLRLIIYSILLIAALYVRINTGFEF